MSEGSYQPIHGAYVRDKNDALILCQAAHVGNVHQAKGISIQQRKQLSTSGALFVFEKTAAEMERWTDGRGWSRSRQLPDKFFVYFEEYANTTTSTSAGLSNDEPTTTKRTKRNDPSDMLGALVGPLRYLPGFSPGVLIKKTITLKFPHAEWHVVSYFTVRDVLSGRLPSVSDHPHFQGTAMHATDDSQSIGPMLPSPPPSMPMGSVSRQGRLRSSTWSNGSGTPMDVMQQDMHGRSMPSLTRGLHSRVIAPPRLDSLPRHHSYGGVIPVNDGFCSDPTSPVRGVPLAPLDTSMSMSPNRRASAPTGYPMPTSWSGSNSPNSATFAFEAMPFQIPSLCTPPYASSPQHQHSFGQAAFPATAHGVASLGSPSVQQHSNFQSPASASSLNMGHWGLVEHPPPVSPTTCFVDYEGYYGSTLTPDQGSQHSSPTLPELYNTGGSAATMEPSSADFDQSFLDVGHWSFEEEGRDCLHEQITPKASEHAPIPFDDGMLGGHDSASSMDYHQMQWMDPNCHTWSGHA